MADVMDNKTLLDQLMGRDRDNVKGEVLVKKHRYYDPRVCKSYICGFCPHELFVNSRVNCGPCSKVHDDDAKYDFETTAPNDVKSRFYVEFIKHLLSFVSNIDKSVLRSKRRLRLTNPTECERVSLSDAKLERHAVLVSIVAEAEKKVEMLSEQGLVDETRQAQEDYDTVLEEMRFIEKTIERDRIYDLHAEGYMSVCNLCGAYLGADDTCERSINHVNGRQHNGFIKVRETIGEICARWPAVKKVYDGWYERKAEREAAFQREAIPSNKAVEVKKPEDKPTHIKIAGKLIPVLRKEEPFDPRLGHGLRQDKKTTGSQSAPSAQQSFLEKAHKKRDEEARRIAEDNMLKQEKKDMKDDWQRWDKDGGRPKTKSIGQVITTLPNPPTKPSPPSPERSPSRSPSRSRSRTYSRSPSRRTPDQFRIKPKDRNENQRRTACRRLAPSSLPNPRSTSFNPPPRKNKYQEIGDVDNSPPRRKRSETPPRRSAHRQRRQRDLTPSPQPKHRRQKEMFTPSPSPPPQRRRKKQMSLSPSPPPRRRRKQATPSPSPPPKRRSRKAKKADEEADFW